MRSVVKRSDVVKQNLCTKNINGIDYTANDYGYVKSSTGKTESPKYKIKDEFDTEFYVGKKAWESKNVIDTTTKNSPLHPDGKRFKDNHKQVEIVEEEIETPKLTELFPMPLLIEHKTPRQILEEYGCKYISQYRLNKFNTTVEEMDDEDVVDDIFCEIADDEFLGKKVWREMLKIFHPDRGLYPDNDITVYLTKWADEF